MTLVIFSAAVSAANSAIYASSRMLWSMAGDHFAPARFSRVSRNGVPVNAILLTAVLALVSMLTRYISAQQLYLYLIASTGQVGCLAWIVIGWCQYRFRRAVDRGEYPSSLLRYRSPFVSVGGGNCDSHQYRHHHRHLVQSIRNVDYADRIVIYDLHYRVMVYIQAHPEIGKSIWSLYL